MLTRKHVYRLDDVFFSEKILFNEPVFKDFWKSFVKTRSELYEESVLKGVKLFGLRKKYNWTEEEFDIANR